MEGCVPDRILSACDLPHAWAGCDAWTVLDTDLGVGHNFFSTWSAWRSDPLRPRVLHYVAMIESTASIAFARVHPSDMVAALADACKNVSPGFNRLLFDRGQVSMTLCVGELPSILEEHNFRADTLFLGTHQWYPWLPKQLAKRCRRGTRCHARSMDAHLWTSFVQEGFRLETQTGSAPTLTDNPLREITGAFEPSWNIKNSRQNSLCSTPMPPARCAVVGAGLSGATVAHALALRGWQVRVLDIHARPAGAASGLPAGLIAPSFSADDNVHSRISRNGVNLMLQHCQRLLLPGRDWELTGVQEHRPPSPAEKGATPQTVLHWHAQAGWIKPAALVHALLEQQGITFVGNAQVNSLQNKANVWLLYDVHGQLLCQAELVVFANALACVPLLRAPALTPLLGKDVQTGLEQLHGVSGTLTCGSHGEKNLCATASFPSFPVNGYGNFLPRIPKNDTFEWFAGSTFEPQGSATALDLDAQHRINLERLRQLLPTTAQALEPMFANTSVHAWTGTRCVSKDRLPLVGRVGHDAHANLWINAAMGSKGLSFSALCAELLVAQLGAEPLPLENRLARKLDARRHAKTGKIQ